MRVFKLKCWQIVQSKYFLLSLVLLKKKSVLEIKSSNFIFNPADGNMWLYRLFVSKSWLTRQNHPNKLKIFRFSQFDVEEAYNQPITLLYQSNCKIGTRDSIAVSLCKKETGNNVSSRYFHHYFLSFLLLFVSPSSMSLMKWLINLKSYLAKVGQACYLELAMLPVVVQPTNNQHPFLVS